MLREKIAEMLIPFSIRESERLAFADAVIALLSTAKPGVQEVEEAIKTIRKYIPLSKEGYAEWEIALKTIKNFAQISNLYEPSNEEKYVLAKDGICYYCGKPTENLSGNPTKWGIPLCHENEPGKVKPHHIGCVMEKLAEKNNQTYEPMGEEWNNETCGHCVFIENYHCRRFPSWEKVGAHTNACGEFKSLSKIGRGENPPKKETYTEWVERVLPKKIIIVDMPEPLQPSDWLREKGYNQAIDDCKAALLAENK